MIEHLEPRQFLDAVIHGHELTITATSGDDVITMPVETVPEFEPNGDIVRVLQTTVMVNGVNEGEFSTRNISRVVVDLRSGNDSFSSGVSRGRKFKLFVIGGPGNDTIIGGGKADKLDGGPGNDSMVGNDGSDLFISGAGSDTIVGGAGGDHADFSQHTGALHITMDDVANDGETALGETSNVHSDVETVIGGAGADLMDASMRPIGDYMFVGNGGKNTLLGGGGNDTLIGGPKNDSLRGNAGNDLIQGHAGRDKMYGGTGVDHIIAGDDNERDTINGPLDQDTIDTDFLDIGTAVPEIPPPSF